MRVEARVWEGEGVLDVERQILGSINAELGASDIELRLGLVTDDEARGPLPGEAAHQQRREVAVSRASSRIARPSTPSMRARMRSFST